jgi:hypothetical protein
MSALMSLKDECQKYRDLVVRAAHQRQDLVARLIESQRIAGTVRDAARAGARTSGLPTSCPSPTRPDDDRLAEDVPKTALTSLDASQRVTVRPPVRKALRGSLCVTVGQQRGRALAPRPGHHWTSRGSLGARLQLAPAAR